MNLSVCDNYNKVLGESMKPILQHIIAKILNGRPVVIADDWELYDMISDVLIEDHDLDVEFIILDEHEGVEQHILYFKDDVSLPKLQEIINSIGIEEINRVWSLNNSQ